MTAEAGAATITLEWTEAALAMRALRYGDDEHYDVVSAFIKSIRGSDVDAALYWLARMLEAGEDARFIARRLVILASEDVGMADPNALPLATAAAHAVEYVGLPEAQLNLAHAVIYLATAPKSNSATVALGAAMTDVRDRPTGSVPAHLRDSHYAGAAHLGHGEGYVYPHDTPEGWVPQEYRPAEIAEQVYYRPTGRGPTSTADPGSGRRQTQRAEEVPMSAGDWLAATAAVLLAVLLGGLLFALGSVVVTLRDLRSTVRALQDESIALAAEMRVALRDAENEVDRVGALITAAESVGDHIDTASRIVSKTVTNPVVKVLALGTGTKRAMRRMRTGDSR